MENRPIKSSEGTFNSYIKYSHGMSEEEDDYFLWQSNLETVRASISMSYKQVKEKNSEYFKAEDSKLD